MNLCFPLWIKSFPIRTVTLSSRYPPWMTLLVKQLLKKKSRTNASGNVARAKELSKRVSEVIAENRMNLGRAETTGIMQWWRRVDNQSLKGKTNHSLSWTGVFYVVWMNFSKNFVKMTVERSLRSKKSTFCCNTTLQPTSSSTLHPPGWSPYPRTSNDLRKIPRGWQQFCLRRMFVTSYLGWQCQ